MEPLDGVIKFQAEHRTEALPAERFGPLAAALLAWRAILHQLGGIGQVPDRYGGAGYGNVSGRTGPFPGAPGARPFLVTGTQTGGISCLSLADFCFVERWSLGRSRIESRGERLPSSEAMTHGALYDLGPHIRFVFHAHCPVVWRNARALRLPTTSPDAAHGTPAMATEMGRLWRETPVAEGRVLAMGGHEDGVVSFGRSAEEAGQAFVGALARAYATECAVAGRLCTPAGPTGR